MVDLFADMPGIFEDTFGEPVVYTPAATGVPLGADGVIQAIWIETPGLVVQGEADSDAIIAELHVQAAIVAAPAEGDTARRVADGKTAKVVPPFRPDGNGMIVCGLEVT